MNLSQPMKSGVCSVILVDASGVIVSMGGELEDLLSLTSGQYVGVSRDRIEDKALQELLDRPGLVVFNDRQGKVQQFHHHVHQAGETAVNGLEVHIFQNMACMRELQAENDRLRIENHELQLTDAITHLMTERAIHLALEPQVSRCRRYDSSLSVVKLAFEVEKAIADSVENDAQALMISRVLKDQLRWADLIARTGSNEFLIALPETGEADAKTIVQKLQQNICLKDETCSIRFGIAEWEKGNNTGDLLYRADESLGDGRHNQDVA